ncbi:hypothetical protein [Actinokineospora enzanensis]|uniref:hypothetical protein n=1 Tax=Actinokineospora enzanensis TaxID=155975 RepID=UPI000373D5D6|nr:hypothetical protein [Actinokineospora enzanensis]
MDHAEEQERLLRSLREELARAREDPAAWAELAFDPGRHDDGRAFDRNWVARFRVLWAMQYDRREQDLPLLRYLMEQQITYYREVVRWGMGTDLALPGFLLAEHRRVEDVWLHWQARETSFDTNLGYRAFHLLAAGVETTTEAVRASAHPDRERLLDALGSPRCTAVAFEEWLVKERRKFPVDPVDEDLRTWARRTASLGECELSRLFMHGWSETQPRTKFTLEQLRFHLADLDYLDEAVRLQKDIIALDGQGSRSELETLAELERRAGNFDGALHALREAERLMPGAKDGSCQGIWRHFIRDYFALVPLAPDEHTARELFATADRHLLGVVRLWMDSVLGAGMAAAEHIGDPELIRRYRGLRLAADYEREEDSRRSLQGYETGR